MKLFSTVNINVVTSCQCYSGYLSLYCQLDLLCLKFYQKLQLGNTDPASTLFKWFEMQELNSLATKYNIQDSHRPRTYKCKVRTYF